MPLFRYAEVQINSYSASFYSGKFRLKLELFAGEPYIDLWKEYLAGDLLVEIREVYDYSEGRLVYYRRDGRIHRYENTMNIYFDVPPSGEYKIKIYPRGQLFWRLLSQMHDVTELEYGRDYKGATNRPNMILHIR